MGCGVKVKSLGTGERRVVSFTLRTLDPAGRERPV
jgi:hypothetical protein